MEAEIAKAITELPTRRTALAETEVTARDIEVALAQALARQAAQTADARIAQAAAESARARVARASGEVETAERALAAIGAPEPIETERREAAAIRATALVDAETARDSITAAERAQSEAETARDSAQSTRAARGAELAALDAEAAALSKATQVQDRDRMLDRIVAAPGYERAVAAALGDDLEFGIDPAADTHWAGAVTQTSDPDVPEDVRLTPHVEAPAELVRRLSQIIVVDRDDGRILSPGQRLVTRNGVLRRWDGFVAKLRRWCCGGTS